MRAAIVQVARRLHGQSMLFIALWEAGPSENIGQVEFRFVPYQKSPNVVALHYQAADVYVHAARTDTFPNTILEALACGTPVVATAVGGIPEQVKGAGIANGKLRITDLNRYGPQEATGLLVPPGDVEGMADGIERLLTDEPLRRRLAENAAKDAGKRFDLEHQVEAYLEWYEEILSDLAQQRLTSSVSPQPFVKGGLSQ